MGMALESSTLHAPSDVATLTERVRPESAALAYRAHPTRRTRMAIRGSVATLRMADTISISTDAFGMAYAVPISTSTDDTTTELARAVSAAGKEASR